MSFEEYLFASKNTLEIKVESNISQDDFILYMKSEHLELYNQIYKRWNVHKYIQEEINISNLSPRAKVMNSVPRGKI